jgi:PPOX class probable F420-dependent enzyme
VDEATTRARVGRARVARLATVRADGTPHVVPCCFALDGDTVYSAVDDAKPKSTAALVRLANVRAQPRASLLVDHYDDDWSQLWWVRVDGASRVLETGDERERALDLLVAKYVQYRDARPPGAVLVIDIDTWRAWP